MSEDIRKYIAEKIAWRMWGLPYIWGGDDPVSGFDCSGMVIEILKSVGLLPRDGDWSADSLYRKYKARLSSPKFGCLVFWGTPDKVTHIEMMMDEYHTIGASGGGSKNKTLADAIRTNAYVKIRPLASRNTPVAIVDPFA